MAATLNGVGKQAAEEPIKETGFFIFFFSLSH
jgi:hypothetical protein